MSQNIFKNFENFWNKNDIKQKAEDYHNYFENPEQEGEFSWFNEKDKDNLKKKDIEKSMKWGVPNHILGDIDKAKFIIGLLNPGINITEEDAEKCETVGTYIKKVTNKEMGENRNLDIRIEEKKHKIPFPGSSKEVYEEEFNKELNIYDFYYNHILDKENVLSQELKKLYKLYNDNIDFFKELKNQKVEKINESLEEFAYYFCTYYKGCFDRSSYKGCFDGLNQIQTAIYHYENIFEKINKAKRQTDKKKIDQKFKKALFEMPITNIELIPYISEEAPNDIGLESSKVSANAIIEKIMQDKDTIVILRSYEVQNSRWKKLFEDICEEKNINFKTHIEPSIYTFKNPQGTVLSKNSIKPANSNNSIKSTEQVAKELNESINLSDFEKELDKELDNIIEANK